MFHPLVHEVAQNQVPLLMHGILDQGHKDGTTKQVELQNLFKTKLPILLHLALRFMWNWISECI